MSPSICTPPQVGGAASAGGVNAFSRTSDFYQNGNELMIYGGPWALERNQKTTGDRVEAGNAWG